MSEARTPLDVLIVSLGTTFGLRASDDQLADLLTEAGQRVELVRARPVREVRTLALTDLVQARACAQAARDALRRFAPAQIIYASMTAALCWPRPGAIRFDALAQRTRPGHHGCWQRPVERQRLRQAPLLLPYAEASLDGAPSQAAARAHVVPVAIESATHDRVVHEAVDALLTPIGRTGGRVVAVTYAADAAKKGLDRILSAWRQTRAPHEVLLIAGSRDGGQLADHRGDGIIEVGRLPREVFRALVRAVGLYVTAPRREDYGLVQLEALAEGARVVTTAAPGPYAALPLVRELWPEQVVEHGDDIAALGRSIRFAIDARPDPIEQLRATRAVAPWSRAAVLARVERELVPALAASAR